MKKICGLLLILALVLSLSGCGSFVSIMPGTELAADAAEGEDTETAGTENFKETSLFDFMGLSDFGENYYSDTPVAMSFQYNTEADGCISPVFDRASIVAACDALRSITVTGSVPVAEGTARSEWVFTFTMSNGETHTVSFNNGNLSMYTGEYTITGGDALWEIAFPAYNANFDVFDLYYDDTVRAFADGFYDNMPVSVGRRTNGGATLTSEDSAVITQVFEALAGASVTLVENTPDQNIDLTQTQDYIFTMSDGTTYTFSFAQRCLAVQVSNVYGTTYYWLSGLDSLWNVQIVPDDGSGDFTGGALTEMREDIQIAADIASGQRDDLSISGVYVGYTINGESGYLTLSGDTANSFVTTVANVISTGELVEEPTGETITVSVTLSDWSGPIFYFTGDSVQQVMGTSYACDAGSMETLRSTILSLAASGNNTVEVEDTAA